MAEYQTVFHIGDIPIGEGRMAEVGNKLIAIFNDGGRYFAIDDVCPHMGASLSTGCLEQGIVTCSWHAWRFRLADGAWADYPRIKIGWYPVRIEGDAIQVLVEPRPK
jgi:nitrite reductase (NADH) small subunit/3-phenylpropionate/trans-cinnamate dioxygenase ferredoxin subunit